MLRRELLLGTTTGAAVIAARSRWAAASASTAAVRGMHGRAHVIDMCGGLHWGDNKRYDPDELRTRAESGVTAAAVTIGVEEWEEAVTEIAKLEAEVTRLPRHLLIARRQADLEAARSSRRLAMIFATQGSLLIGRDLDRVDILYGLGVRVFQLTYNRGDLVGDGCLEPRDGGLTRFGRELVARLNERRIAVDVAHCGPRTTREANEASKQPVLVTHSGASAVFPHPRNKDDATLKALADRGGVAGIYLMPFLGRPRDGGPATLDMALDHIEHALRVCGQDHVGIGTDGGIAAVPEPSPEDRKKRDDWLAGRRKEGIAAPEEERLVHLPVPELNTPRRYENIALGLARRGHPLRVIENVLGRSFHRALGAIWA